MMSKILVTGVAGFIGFHLAQSLLKRGDVVVGIDNMNDYYTPQLKEARLSLLLKESAFKFVKGDISDRKALPELFATEHFDKVVNLAAQAGVRYSIENPFAYIDSNLVGFANVLECCRHYGTQHLVYASSSSVYGGNTKVPFSEDDMVDSPVSLYAATKKSNELMACCYSNLYKFPSTGLRFFTVYGPWGRPDMAPVLFATAIRDGKPIKVFNNGNMKRDFTYIDDIVEGIIRVLDSKDNNSDNSPNSLHYVYNIGCSNPVNLMDFIEEIETSMGRKAEKIMMPMQPGDVYQTYANTTKLERDMGYKPHVSLREGIGEFIKWFKTAEQYGL
ncbi:MAG: NAD-dependent epimerase [Prevotellaceae bacterium]|nr:NAD-dependent epimerase [Candidatus Colivivens equi]